MIIETSAYSLAPPERLWSLVADLDRWAAMLPTVSLVQVPDLVQKPGPGARYRLTQPGLPPAVYEVTDWQPGRSFTWESAALGVRTVARHEVLPIGAGSRVRLALDWTGPLAVLAKLALASRARRMVTDEADTFAKLAEDGRDHNRHDAEEDHR